VKVHLLTPEVGFIQCAYKHFDDPNLELVISKVDESGQIALLVKEKEPVMSDVQTTINGDDDEHEEPFMCVQYRIYLGKDLNLNDEQNVKCIKFRVRQVKHE
jgi:hypothetical protein